MSHGNMVFMMDYRKLACSCSEEMHLGGTQICSREVNFEHHSCSRKVSYGVVDDKRAGMRGPREGQ
jgi:hypothetical protein